MQPMTKKLDTHDPAPDIWQQWLAEETTCLKEKEVKEVSLISLLLHKMSISLFHSCYK